MPPIVPNIVGGLAVVALARAAFDVGRGYGRAEIVVPLLDFALQPAWPLAADEYLDGVTRARQALRNGRDRARFAVDGNGQVTDVDEARR